MSVASLCQAIKAYIARGEEAGREHYVTAGHRLIELRAGKGVTARLFESIVKERIGIGVRQARRYMAWARDESKYEKERERERAHGRRHDAKRRGDSAESHAQAAPAVKSSAVVLEFPSAGKPMGERLEGGTRERATIFRTMTQQGDFTLDLCGGERNPTRRKLYRWHGNGRGGNVVAGPRDHEGERLRNFGDVAAQHQSTGNSSRPNRYR